MVLNNYPHIIPDYTLKSKYEAFAAKGDEIKREKYFKTSKGKSTLKLMLRDTLK